MASRFLDLHRRASQACVPLNVTFEITLRCNLRCVHCYNFDRELGYHPEKVQREELGDAEIHRILDEVRDEGCMFLAFTGGEALAHPRLGDFVRHASGAGMAVTLKSNGTLLRREAVSRLAAEGASAIEISLYGAEADTHDAFVKRAGAFSRTLAGAVAARDAGLRVRFSFVVARENAGEVERMIGLADSLGIRWAIDPQITARYDGSRSSLDLRVDEAALERLYRGPLHHLVQGEAHDGSSVQCGCARTVCGISAFGEVYPCIGAPVPSGNLRERSFRETWRESPTLRWIRGLTLDDFPACKDCGLRRWCRRNSGVVYSNTGEYIGPREFGGDFACMEAVVVQRINAASPAAVLAGASGGALHRHSFE